MTGICPVCCRAFAVVDGGIMRGHRSKLRTANCSGSGKPPFCSDPPLAAAETKQEEP